MILDECQEQRKQQFQQSAELVRLQTATLVNIQLKKEDHLKPAELWHFEWDNVETHDRASENEPAMTDEQIKQHNTKLAAMLD